MKVLRIDPKNPDPAVIAQVADVLRCGGVIIYPTDTCYGLGADPRSLRSKQRIAKIKHRDESKKYSVISKDIPEIEKLAIVNDEQRLILTSHLPGPFTFILLAAYLQFLHSNTVGFRVPNYAITQQLSSSFGKPFISTSANFSGQPAIYSIGNIHSDFLELLETDELPDLVLDAGNLPLNPPSTVVDLVSKPPVIIRQGAAVF